MRPLTPADRDAGYALSTEAGWNQTRDDWSRWLAAAAGAAYGIDDGPRLIATAGAVVYDADLAWIGCVLTAESHRGRGHASHLMRTVVDQLTARAIKLDATAVGRPLYVKLGFRDEQEIVRWRREPAPFDATPTNSIGRPGRTAWHFGPVIGPDATIAARATVAAHAQHAIVWDILAGNPAAAALAESLGFTPSRRLMRMVRGADLARNDAEVWACAGFEWG